MQIKIGLIGEIRAGKDTVADMIAEELQILTGGFTARVAFSEGIHKVIELIMPERYEEGKPRHELQYIGQSMRELKPNVWIDYTLNSDSYKEANRLGHHVIVTDVRQVNEAVALKEKCFYLIKVIANPAVRLERMRIKGDNYSPEMLLHETESSVNKCIYDYLIDNSYNLEYLRAVVREALKEAMSDAY